MKNAFIFAAALFVVGFFTTTAQATPITIDVHYNGMENGSENISASLLGRSNTVMAGMISFSHSNPSAPLPFNFDGDLLAFCIEFSQMLNTSQTMQYTITAAHQWFSALQADAITRLYTGFGSQTGTARNDAAFQLALWELVYDFNGTDFTGLSLASGNFKANRQSTSVTLANSWLNQLANVTSQHTMFVMTNAHSQNQLIFTGNNGTPFNEPLPVSAPATFGIFCLGLFGLALRRRLR